MAYPEIIFTRRYSTVLRMGSYLVAISLFCLNYWINRYFGAPDIDQIAYHLQFGAEGFAASDPAVLRRFVRWCVLAPLILLSAVLMAEHWLAGRGNPLVSYVLPALPAVVLLSAVGLWLYQLSVLEYAASSVGPDYFIKHYVPPSTVTVRGVRPKNLILIYVESMESGYSNRQVFGDNLIAPLTDLDASSFSSYQQMPGTGWTIAAIVSTQCAVPLKRVTIFDEHTQGEMVQSFLPNATCLGDILAKQGYRNVFMGGGSPTFSGKGKFLRTHHYQEVFGKEDWQRQGVPDSAMNGWGLFDDDLFSRARSKLSQLHRSGQPFNLTLLTVDSHEPAGYLSSSCAQRGYSGFDGVIRCTATEVAAFVHFVRERGYLTDTNIVILGDHLARRNPLSDGLERLPERSLFNAFIAQTAPVKNREQLVHFDLLPTILEFNGFTVSGGRLGLGYSGFNYHRAQPEPHRLTEMRSTVLNRSETYRSLWIASEP